ncbi:MAG: hypothetical protein CBB68_14400 [Rhodospirillaceae bacterium TMED8]|nr:hypothetical protein [Magnetovibrio sp.]OUT48142.1 MAG: hypothetical protein CBB68_14400 [Rhodospirillaceae bacterium TMED8]|tara:strand:- start:1134 stop:2318 length:1185 start_codon:yes stop_codon:yes gene_type:complete
MFQEVMIVTNGNIASWAAALIRDLLIDFRERGCNSEVIDLSTVETSQINVLLSLWNQNTPERLLITLNARLQFPKFMTDGSAYKVGWSHFCWLLDNPAHHYEGLKSLNEDALVGLVEQSHIKSMRALNLPHKCTLFSHRPDNFDKTPPVERKRISKILIAGNANLLPSIKSTKNKNPPDLHPFIDAAWRAAAEQAKVPAPTLSLFQRSCADMGYEQAGLPRSTLASLLTVVEQLSNTLARLRIVKLLIINHKINLIGNFEGHGFEEAENVNYHGSTDYVTFEKTLKNTRVALNLTPKFSQGTTERVWSTLAAGAVPLTTSTSDLIPYKTAGILDTLDLNLNDDDLEYAITEKLSNENIARMVEARANQPLHALAALSRVDTLYRAFYPNTFDNN